MSVHPRRSVACDCPNHQARDSVHDDGDQEESEADLDEGAQVEIAGGLRELVGDDTGQCVPW